MTAKRVLEECPTYAELRQLFCPTPCIREKEKGEGRGGGRKNG